ncbi:hypothetical protein [Mesorhizobium sp. SP-1A]|uniref:hypothetical protein n=1 Tax=Mesorhizobium sp. SP-1A TaxID=3077840 RepID=UPI0028F72CD8|nr:hypothetical protein [Mesorhizobium sp. SP-1A]
MSRLLSAVLLMSLASPALAQTVDEKGAAELSGNFARYIGKQAIERKLVAVVAKGDAYDVTIDVQALLGLLPEQKLLKSDFPPFTVKVKPRADGNWDVSGAFPSRGAFEVKDENASRSTQFAIKDGKFEGVYDAGLASFLSAASSLAGASMTTRDKMQEAEMTTGAATATMNSTAAQGGGVDFSVSQKIADFVEALKVDEPESGFKFPLTVRSPELAVEASGRGLRSKALLDLLAFGVANGEDAQVKANQAELKALLLAALPLWEHLDGSYGFKDLGVESPLGTFTASQFGVTVAADGISKNGAINYTIEARGLNVPEVLVPAWSKPLVPTEVTLSFGGANIDLDSMARKTIDTLDLDKEPPLPEGFGETLVADFLAETPKLVIRHSTIKSSDAEVAFEGEVTFPGEKPEINTTIDIAGYDKIVETLQAASKTMPEMAQYVPAALAVKGFAKSLPDGRLEWAVNGKPDGSVTVNGVMVKGVDPEPGDGTVTDEDESNDEDGAEATPQ